MKHKSLKIVSKKSLNIHPRKSLAYCLHPKNISSIYLWRSFIFPCFITFFLYSACFFFIFWDIFISFGAVLLLIVFLFFRKILIPFASFFLSIFLFFLLISGLGIVWNFCIWAKKCDTKMSRKWFKAFYCIITVNLL